MPQSLIANDRLFLYISSDQLRDGLLNTDQILTFEVYSTRQDLNQDSLSNNCSYLEEKPIEIKITKFEKSEFEQDGYFNFQVRQVSLYCQPTEGV
jgi:D-lyxose ketol-isomerase